MRKTRTTAKVRPPLRRPQTMTRTGFAPIIETLSSSTPFLKATSPCHNGANGANTNTMKILPTNHNPLTPSSGDASFRLLDVHIKTRHGKSARKSVNDETLKPNFDLELELQESKETNKLLPNSKET